MAPDLSMTTRRSSLAMMRLKHITGGQGDLKSVGVERMVDQLPDPVNADYNFGSYHSKTEGSGAIIPYTRTYEIKELSVAPANAEEVRIGSGNLIGNLRGSLVSRNPMALEPSTRGRTSRRSREVLE